MKNKLKKINRTLFKTTNFKAFSFFLLFSFIIWILVQFSKTYQETIQVPVEFYNPPKDKIVTQKEGHLNLRVRDNGFVLAWFSIFKPNVRVNLNTLPVENTYLIFNAEEQENDPNNLLSINFMEATITNKIQKIPFKQKEVKKVPVQIQTDINYAPGYSSNKEYKITPDSVKISGPKNKLDTIEQIKTLVFSQKNVKKDIEAKLELDIKKYKDISFYTSEVQYFQAVEKFTEGRVEVPITLINAPEDRIIKIFPKKIVVVFKVSLENYDRVGKNDFIVVCDFAELADNQNFLIPKLVKQPNMVTSARLNSNKIQFVIKK